MPKATFFPKTNAKDLKEALSALVRLWLDQYPDPKESSRDLELVCRFIGRAVPSASAGGEVDASR